MRDEWLQARLIQWFEREGNPSKTWICLLRENGRFMYWQIKEGAPPPVDKREYCRRVVAAMNREVHHDGVWLGGWMDEGWRRFYVLWKDRDGDIQFPIDTPAELHWRELRRWPPDVWCEHGENAYTGWKAAIDTMELHPDQTMKLAQGQTRAHANRGGR